MAGIHWNQTNLPNPETTAGAQQKADAALAAAKAYTDANKVTSLPWNSITGKPSTFPPQSHTHTWDQITNKPSTYTPASHTHSWSEITGKPSSFTPSSHTHSWSEITGKPSVYPPDLSNVNIDSLIDVTKFFHKLTPSNVQRAAHTSETYTSSASGTRVVTWNVFGFGQVKVTCELRTQSNYPTFDPAEVRVGSGSDSSSYTRQTTTSTSYVSLELTVTVQPSHVSTSTFEAPVWVEIRADADKNDSSHRAYIRNIRLYYS